jgi:transcriptional regulator with XRE-family HTH domain
MSQCPATQGETLVLGLAATTFGERLRELRKAKGLTLRALASMVDVNLTCLSKIENHKVDFGDYPGEGLIRKPAQLDDEALDRVLQSLDSDE